MANGDAAAAAGMDTVAGTDDRRNGYDEDNKTRDYLAVHQTAGTHPASAITTGVFAAARIPNLSTLAGIAPAATELDNGAGMTLSPTTGTQFTASNGLAVLGAFAANGAVTCPAPYSEVLSTTYRSLYVRSDGRFGYVPSSVRFKKNIKPADLDPAAILGLRVVEFDYKAQYGGGHDTGLIAEEVRDAGLDWLTIDGDQDGTVDGVAYERLAVGLLAVVQAQQQQITELTRRLDGLDLTKETT